MGIDQLGDYKQDGLIISKIFGGTGYGFVEAKGGLCWRTEKCGC